MPTSTLSVTTPSLTAQHLESIAQVDAAQWNAVAGNAQPFVRHEFLLALEESGCASPRQGWTPSHLLLRENGTAVAALPLYVKTHSRGEFVFDFSWANAYHHRGLQYYPKLVTAVPFTPVTGPRLLIADDSRRSQLTSALIRSALDLVKALGLSTWHVLFATPAELGALGQAGLVLRNDCQFHWHNRGYSSFEEFLGTFTAEKRKKVRRERRRVAEAGIRFETVWADAIDAVSWQTIYGFYADTFHRHGHEPYLDLDCLMRIARCMPRNMLVTLARMGGDLVAAAIFFRDDQALYGRYWGAAGQYHSLHFETCYYQGIEYCIRHGLERFEPGTQGEHKVPRGFAPSLTGSAHFIAHRGFSAAISEFAAQEARAVEDYVQGVNEHLPYRHDATLPGGALALPE